MLIAGRLRTEDFATEKVVTLEPSEEGVLRWALGLCLLREGVVDVLNVRTGTDATTLKVAVADTVRVPFVSHWNKGKLTVEVSQVELERWVHFFLSYFRDGYGEVDHIDVETVSAEVTRPITLTLKVPTALEPVSAEEAARRLGQ